MPARDPSAPTHITVPSTRMRDGARGSLSYSYAGTSLVGHSHVGGTLGASGAGAGAGAGQSADLAEMDQNVGGPILPVHRGAAGASSPSPAHFNGNGEATGHSPNVSGQGGRSNPSSSNWSRAPGYSHIHTGASLGRHGYGSFSQRLGQIHPTAQSGSKSGKNGDSGAAEEAGQNSSGFMAQLLRRVSGDKGRGDDMEGNGKAAQDHSGMSGYGHVSAAGAQPAPMEGGRAGGEMVGNAKGSTQHGESTWSAFGSRRGSMVDDYAPPRSPADLLSKSHAAIRDSTNRLASMSFSRPRRRSVAQGPGTGELSSQSGQLPTPGTPSVLPSPWGDSSAAPTPDPERIHRAVSPRSPTSSRTSPSPSRGGADRARRRSSGAGHRPLIPSQLSSTDGRYGNIANNGHGLLRVTEAEDPSPPKSLGNSRSGLSLMLHKEKERRANSAEHLAGASGSRSDEDVKVGETGFEADPDKTPMPRNQALAPMTDSNPSTAAASRSTSFHKTTAESGDTTPKATRSALDAKEPTSEVRANINQPRHVYEEEEEAGGSSLRRYLAAAVATETESGVTERTGLLSQHSAQSWYGQDPPSTGHAKKAAGVFGRIGEQLRDAKRSVAKTTPKQAVAACVVEPVKLLPAVILGSLLNVLDGVSYGMILFPANSYFLDFGSLGVSMFFVTCIISQLIFTLGGSIFPGGNGSMMIEAVPFFHILVNIIESEIGDDPASIIATTMVSFAFSSILTGIVFYSLGAFKLGGLIGYFPRHILVGCIGGVGVFLLETGLEVSRGLKEEGFQYDLATLHIFFESWHAIVLWALPLFLAVLLRVITHFFHHQLIFPAYFFIIPIVFYIIIAIGGWSFVELREWGWVFDVGAKKQEWWKFYTLFDFGKTNWKAFWAAMPTQLALVFFGILHVPLNVPALGVSLAEDNVNLDRELTAHGYTNLAAGAFGVVPNYLCYVNTVLFYRIGGGSRQSGLMLAAATSVILVVGPTMIGYLPITLVGALIMVLGIDLLLEAVWDTRHKTNKMEYITIWAIAIGMTVWDFVIGLLFGIILACIFFVVQSSRRRPIRAVFDGSTAKSTVRRPRSQRAFIQQVGRQTCVMKLQGFLFFGTITVVEDEIRKLLDLAIWQHNPIRFLVIDFKLVYGLDFSSAEAFVRIQRLLAAKDVMLVMCGAKPDGVIATALQGVGLWTPANRDGADGATDGGQRIEVFSSLNDALEWSENAYLTAFYEQQLAASDKDIDVESEGAAVKQIDFPKVKRTPFSLATSYANSPRRAHLAQAGGDTLYHRFLSPRGETAHLPSDADDQGDPIDGDSFDVYSAEQPLPLLVQTFASYPDAPPPSFYASLAPFFTRRHVSANEVLWKQGEPADALYIIEAGSLRATYAYHDDREWIQETMVAGTVAGDLSMLSQTQRNATVVVERPGTLWYLDREGLKGMYEQDAQKAREFVRVVLKAVAEEQDVLSSHLIAVLS